MAFCGTAFSIHFFMFLVPTNTWSKSVLYSKRFSLATVSSVTDPDRIRTFLIESGHLEPDPDAIGYRQNAISQTNYLKNLL
jgi:hypothetical protein